MPQYAFGVECGVWVGNSRMPLNDCFEHSIDSDKSEGETTPLGAANHTFRTSPLERITAQLRVRHNPQSAAFATLLSHHASNEPIRVRINDERISTAGSGVDGLWYVKTIRDDNAGLDAIKTYTIDLIPADTISRF